MKREGETNRETVMHNTQLYRVSAYLTTLSAARTTMCQMVGWLVNNELGGMWE